MTSPSITLQYQMPAALIVLNRPEARNAISARMISEIGAAFSEILDKKGVAGVVLTGAGATFSAGADLHQLQASVQAGVDSALEDSEHFMRFLLDIYTFPKPVVAAVNGPALGGGCGLAAACDLVMASETAIFGYPEVRIGFVPALVSVFLAGIMGEKRAREMMLTGRHFSAAEAEKFGLVNKIVPEAELLSSASEVVRLIAQNSPAAVSMTKELLAEICGLSLQEALRLAASKNTLSRFSQNFSEGIAAFLEKRSADFQKK